MLRYAKNMSHKLVSKAARNDAKERKFAAKMRHWKKQLVRGDDDAEVNERGQSIIRDTWDQARARQCASSLSGSSEASLGMSGGSDTDSMEWATSGTYDELERPGLYDNRSAVVEQPDTASADENVLGPVEEACDGRSVQRIELEEYAMIANIFLHRPEPDEIASPKPRRTSALPRLESWEAELASAPEQATNVSAQSSGSAMSDSRESITRPRAVTPREMVETSSHVLLGRSLCQKMKTSVLKVMAQHDARGAHVQKQRLSERIEDASAYN